MAFDNLPAMEDEKIVAMELASRFESCRFPQSGKSGNKEDSRNLPEVIVMSARMDENEGLILRIRQKLPQGSDVSENSASAWKLNQIMRMIAMSIRREPIHLGLQGDDEATWRCLMKMSPTHEPKKSPLWVDEEGFLCGEVRITVFEMKIELEDPAMIFLI